MDPSWEEHLSFLPPFWTEFAGLLHEQGFTLWETSYSHAYFGSRTVVLRRRRGHLWLRLVFDGRDQYWNLEMACEEATVAPREFWGAAWWARWAGLTQDHCVEPQASEVLAKHLTRVLKLTEGIAPDELTSQVSMALQGT